MCRRRLFMMMMIDDEDDGSVDDGWMDDGRMMRMIHWHHGDTTTGRIHLFVLLSLFLSLGN